MIEYETFLVKEDEFFLMRLFHHIRIFMYFFYQLSEKRHKILNQLKRFQENAIYNEICADK